MKKFNLSGAPLSLCLAVMSLAACGAENGTVSKGDQQIIASSFLPLTQQHIYGRKPWLFSGETRNPESHRDRPATARRGWASGEYRLMTRSVFTGE